MDFVSCKQLDLYALNVLKEKKSVNPSNVSDVSVYDLYLGSIIFKN